MGVPLYRWMVYFMDHPIQIDDLGVPHFRKPPLVGGFNPFEKYERQLGVWNSQYMESHKSHVPHHQPGSFKSWLFSLSPW